MTDALDHFDLKILGALQANAALTNQDIAELIGLSASQISRRRQRLEKDGYIRRYRADLSPQALGLAVTAYVGVTLGAHSRENARKFRNMVKAMPEVQEAHTMTGDVDYILKIVVPDLQALSRVINDDLLPQEAVQNVRSSIAMETLKDDNLLPLRYGQT
ncbi:AsnC family transcriptional regulator [Roseibium hamelinense]|uniref:AsnC family transcriptional regulator n=1 Tax=Roseibium hamelinense TaxID=150831 RepID=A0A562SQ76_9HYPH|nr:Lrp/AsnC family transcriptional regulator [Roseibium hamelinense]MTI44323.1 Lrp/AsnC family transcriptional regulator [Roseibium hamelinense]TWI82900.1 AsnC family transcriptional regulator [Roseibium hamelinense]